MSEATLYETIGRQAMDIADRQRCYTALLNLLANVVGGQIDPSRVLVNLTAGSWTIAEEGARPATPAVINGLPAVVIAPEKPEPELSRNGSLEELAKGV
jgi:hypothetical protein